MNLWSKAKEILQINAQCKVQVNDSDNLCKLLVVHGSLFVATVDARHGICPIKTRKLNFLDVCPWLLMCSQLLP